MALVASRLRRLIPSGEFKQLRSRLIGMGLEIGGPSTVFERGNRWPIYSRSRRLDVVDFTEITEWSKHAGPSRKRFRERFVADATELVGLRQGRYDYLLASHVLEHIANPIKALVAWNVVVRPGGTIVLVVPHGQGSFDRRRAVTPLQHLVEDYRSNRLEDDESHMHEALSLHDFALDPGAGTPEAFAGKIRDNFQHRVLHHHVFSTDSLLALLSLLRVRILFVDVALPHHICIAYEAIPPQTDTIADAGERAVNESFISKSADWRKRSPFRYDRQPGFKY